MENNNSTLKKFLSVIGIIISLVFFGLSGAVLFEMFSGSQSVDTVIIIYAIILILAGILILKISIGALSKKEKKEKKPMKPITLFLGCLAFCAACIFIGITSDSMFLTWAGFTLIILFSAIIFSTSKDRKKLKNHTEEAAEEILQNKNKHGGIIAVLVIIFAIVLGLFLTDLSMESVNLGDLANSGGSSSNVSVCKSCDREFSDSSNKRSIARTGMCSNCYGNFKSMSEYIGR